MDRQSYLEREYHYWRTYYPHPLPPVETDGPRFAAASGPDHQSLAYLDAMVDWYHQTYLATATVPEMYPSPSDASHP